MNASASVRFTARFLGFTLGLMAAASALPGAVQVTGTVVDASTGEALEARIYLRRLADDRWLFVKSLAEDGEALPYAEQWVPMPHSVERHTTIDDQGFATELEPGEYELTVERGKEYLPFQTRFHLTDQPRHWLIELKRWVHLAQRGWYSGETHVHRRLQELPNVMRAEDLNVAFPVTFWTTEAYETPHLRPSGLRRQGPSPFGDRQDGGHAPIVVDDTHLIYPRNTEYEVFSVDGKAHVLGAVFILNHQSRFEAGMPPVAEIARQAHAEGALLDLDKHSWPWSMMLVPIAKIDLFELCNNSVWRTEFGFRRASVEPPAYMNIEAHPDGGMTERGWLDYGFQNYYALLNCGFRLQPTAGTASGVHPVPLGYSRVYVKTGENFSGDAWLEGLRQGRSFVTTGPMIFATLDDKDPGEPFSSSGATPHTLRGEILSANPLERIEVIQHGEVVHSVPVQAARTTEGAYRTAFTQTLSIKETSWVALRCFEWNGPDRVRFAHTSPWHFSINNEPHKPRPEEIAYLIERVSGEIERNRSVLSAEALAEFEKALEIYQQIARRLEAPSDVPSIFTP